MAKLKNEEVLKVETLSILDFTKKYHPGLSPQSVSYAMDNDKVDYVQIGHERLVVMTEKTKGYTPNESKLRDVPVTRKGGRRAVLQT